MEPAAGGGTAVVHAALERRLAQGRIAIPVLPEVAVRVLRLRSDERADAAQLATLVMADVALASAVLRFAGSAARAPLEPIRSLQQAIAWLGFDETAALAFTLVVQGRLLTIPGQNQAVRTLWRHALASALWARELAQRVAYDPGLCYLCGLLHGVGKPLTLAIVHDVAQQQHIRLAQPQYEQLVETFHRPVGALAADAWGLPAAVAAAIAHWEAYDAAGDMRIECNIVALAHRLADQTLDGSSPLAHELLAEERVYTDLGLEPQDAMALAAVVPSVGAEVAKYYPS